MIYNVHIADFAKWLKQHHIENVSYVNLASRRYFYRGQLTPKGNLIIVAVIFMLTSLLISEKSI
ncbi:TPA: hypothetical protein U6640_000968 [Streptococcus agalactiae]|nr:hypothetical protein [Streptococcus agalactiae]